MSSKGSAGEKLSQKLTDQPIMEIIAYFYGAPNPEKIRKYFYEAVKYSKKEEMMPYLKLAYDEVKKQTKLEFSIEDAAEKEYEIIKANRASETAKISYEVKVQLMMEIYGLVFGVDKENFRKIAELRTFIYRFLALYGDDLDERTKKLGMAMAEESFEALKAFEKLG